MWDMAVIADVGAGPWWWDATHWYWALGMHGLSLLVLVAVVVAIVVVFLPARSAPAERATLEAQAAPDGLEILTTRYARGEINRDEYLQRKRDLAWRLGNR